MSGQYLPAWCLREPEEDVRTPATIVNKVVVSCHVGAKEPGSLGEAASTLSS